MTDEPKYMRSINLVRVAHHKHERSQRCRRMRGKSGRWNIKAMKIGWKLLGVCTVCGESVEHYYI